MNQETKTSRLDYKWVILIVCFLMEFLCLGFCSSNVGLYTKAVTEALGIKRSLFSLSFSIRYVAQIVAALYFGTLVGRFGIRKMTCAGLVSLTGSVFLRAFASEVYQIYIASLLWGAGIVFVGSTMAGTIVRRWFRQDVGRYTGIVMSANGIGGAIAAQIISPIINNGETFGYRKAYLLSALIATVIGIVIAIFLRESPSDTVPSAPENQKKKPKKEFWQGFSFDVVRKKKYFYAVAALIFLTGISLQSVGSVTVVYLSDVGLPDAYVAVCATVSSLCLTFSKLFVGMAYDKKGLRFTLTACQLSAVFAFVLKAILTNSVWGMVFAMIATVFSVFALPLETVMIPLLTGDLFGVKSYEKVIGVFTAMNSLGLCLGSPLADLYYDRFGTYKPCFWFFTVVFLLVMVGFFFTVRAAMRDKKAFLEQNEGKSAI